MFDMNEGLMFWTLVVFGILLFVLYRWAYPPILGAVEERERHIQETLDEAAQDREKAAELLAEQERQFASARSRSQDILQEGKRAAERIRQEMLEQAREQQEELLARARRELAVEREAALDALRKEAVDVSIAAAAKLLGRKLDAQEDRRLASDYLSSVASKSGDGTGGGVTA